MENKIILILNNLKKIIPKFNIIGGAAYYIHVPNSETPKDIDIITTEINPSYLDKKGISDYQIYQSNYNDPGQVSDFSLNGFNIQIVDPRYNDWESFREFEFENINGFQVATLDSIIDNTISSKVKKYSNLPILKKWTFKEYIKFLSELKNNENRKNLITNFFIQNLNDEEFDNNMDSIREIVYFNLNKENIKIFQKLYNQINNR
jgi:hypothetical protein